MTQTPTISDTARAAGPALWRLSPVSDAPRLLCLHHAGGNGAFYTSWAAELTGTCEVWTANLPGRRGRSLEPLITDPDILVTELADAAEALLDRPLAIFGHSMGALLGYEVARELRRRGHPPLSALVVSACRAVQLRPEQAPVPRPDAELAGMLKVWGGTPPDLLEDEEFLGLVLPPFRADLTLCEAYRYRPGAALDTPLTALAAAHDDVAPVPDVAAWSVLSTRWRGIHVVEGGHFYLVPARRLVLDVVVRAVTEGASLMRQDGERAG
ncbi:MAG TPA: alpha/beta fold hydrolase [Streptosporangiaceae bacterium]|jgi:surfactin synthase thioesterase subunit|nr:alpha/beta fold hydrolase [Streptosporangiaceae bacterium]